MPTLRMSFLCLNRTCQVMGLGNWGAILVVDNGAWSLSLVPNVFNPPQHRPQQPTPNEKGTAGATAMPLEEGGAGKAGQDRAGPDEPGPGDDGADDHNFE